LIHTESVKQSGETTEHSGSLWLVGSRDRIQHPSRNLSRCHRRQTATGAHPASYPV